MNTLGLDYVNPRYMWLDPASGKGDDRIRRSRARSAIVVVGSAANEMIFALDAWAKRAGTREMVRTFVDMAQRWGPVVAGYEDMGQQSLLLDPLLEEAERRGVMLPLSGQKVNTRVDKNWRIRSILQPLIGHGRLLLNRDLRELRQEITQFPMSNQKDLIDALAGACSLVPPPISQASRAREARDLVAYLRESGAQAEDIEDRLRRFDGYQGADYMPKWQRDLRNSLRYIA